MSTKRLPLFIPPILGFIGLFLPWFTVSTERGFIQVYYLWGIYSGSSPYFFTPLDPFDLPFFMVFLTCVLALALETLGALNRTLIIPPKYEILIGGILAFGGSLNWFFLFSRIVTPTFLSGPGYHYQFISSNWSLGFYVMIANGIVALAAYYFKAIAEETVYG